MRNRVERIRIGLAGSAIFLVLVIAATIGWTHYLTRLRHLKLPERLGVNIVRETNGFTYSQTLGGKTVYTIHAAKAVEHTNGKVALHDVSITLYGRKGDRNDHIYGDEFEYDKNAGLVRATGLVHIDLQAANAQPAGAPAALKGTASNTKVMHVTTSGLVYMEKLGVAATSDDIEFQAGGLTGHARGADYSSDSGVLMLHSAVRMEGVAAGRPVVLTAAEASLDNQNQEIFLTQATYASEGRTAGADQATLHTRSDGTLARVEAKGNVTLGGNGATMVAEQADIGLNATGEPESAVLTHGVRYSVDKPLSQVRGQADAATIAFDGQKAPQPQHAVFAGGVRMTQRMRATNAAGEPWSMRELTAAKLDAVLAPAGPGKSQLRDAEATGSPKLTLVDAGSLARSKGAGETSELSADHMKAHMLATVDPRQSPQLDTIAARGHTVLRQVSADGTEQVSSGDVLDAKFRAKAGLLGANGRAGTALPVGGQVADSLASAVQQGHIAMTRRTPAKAGSKAGEDVSHATAARAAYDGDTDRMTLAGGVKVTDAGSALWANQVVLDRKTGDSEAVGGVKVDYVEDSGNPILDGKTFTNGAPGAEEPTHFLADRAEMVHATDVATFHGKPVRMWRGGNQVQAPVIELDRTQKRMIARSETGTGWAGGAQPAVVHTVLVPTRDAGGGAAKTGPSTGTAACSSPAGGKAGTSNVAAEEQVPAAVRIASGGLVYSGITHEADFTGGLRAETVDGTIRAAQGTAYMTDSASRDGGTVTNGAAVPSPEGSLERVVASGHVVIDQPGLVATGERLLYTASDQVFLLTGSADAPPKATGARGTTTGAALRLRRSCDGGGGDSVEVLGVVPGEPAQKVRTDSRINEDEKKDKGKR